MVYFSKEELCMIEMLTYFNKASEAIYQAIGIAEKERVTFSGDMTNRTVGEILRNFTQDNINKLKEIDDIIDTEFFISGKEWAQILEYILYSNNGNSEIAKLKLADLFIKDKGTPEDESDDIVLGLCFTDNIDDPDEAIVAFIGTADNEEWYDDVRAAKMTSSPCQQDTVSYTTTHFSKYLVIDREIWYDCFRKRIDYRNAPGAAKKSYDIAFVVDVSGSMNNDRLSKAKTSLNTFIDAMYPNDNACLITFNDSGRVVSKYGSSQDDLKRSVTSLSASGGTSTNNGLETGLNELIPNLSNNGNRLPLIILICDGDVQYNNKTIELIKEAIDNNVAIYTINICDSSSVTLEKISAQTGGSSYVATTTDEIAKAIEQLQGKTVSSFDMTDTDSDGLYDVFEINGMRIQNGNIYYTNPYVADSDGDGINDFEEMGTFSNVFHSRSNPNLVDSDNDGYNDLEDPELFTKTKIKNFGTDKYFDEVESEAYNQNSILFEYSWYSLIGDMFYDLVKEKTLINKTSLDIMMQDVNECPYTYLVSDEDWFSFCLYFNERVQKYGEVDIILHYFRNKLNRAPKTLNEMINLISASNVDDKWIMCCPKKGRYHMFGIDGSYNIKFISSNNTDNIYEAVYDKNGNLITENDDYGKNMGTYNYASSSTQSKLHDKFDVKTYENWGNTPNDPKPIADADKNNITKDKDPITTYDTDEYSAKQHYEEVCERIGISYKNLKQMEFSDACY